MSPAPTAQDITDAPKRYSVEGKMSDWEARFLLMSDHWLLQTDAIGICNQQQRSLRDWVNKHRGLEKPHETLRDLK